MNSSTCPTLDILQGLVGGQLTETQAGSVIDHLDTCHQCEQTVNDIEKSGLLRTADASLSLPVASDPECLSMIAGIQNQAALRAAISARDRVESGQFVRDYELISPIGQGAMGTVFKARHTQLNKIVAIKLLTEELSEDQQALARFRREMQAVGQLQHPNIVQALDAGEADGVEFLVMEHVHGIDIGRLTANGGILEVADACEIVRQAALGLQHAHSQGLIHRDIKPSNLMLSRDVDGACRVKVLDLGLAMIVDSDEGTELTDNGQLMGTLKFMSPEQAEDTHNVDHRSDIYSLGATLFRLLTGRVPFSGSDAATPIKRLRALTTSSAPSIAEFRSDLPNELTELINRMLARHADDRPEQMSDVASVLVVFVENQQLVDVLTSSLDESQLQGAGDVAALVDTTPSLSQTVKDLARRDQVRPNPHKKTASGRSPKLGIPSLAVAASLITLIVFGVIWLKTDGGYIRIEADDATNDISVDVLLEGNVVDKVQVGVDQKQFWYRSGNYEIRLAADSDDMLVVSPQVVKLSRRGNEVVTISRVTDSVTPTVDAGNAIDAGSSDPSRTEILEWVINHNGTISVVGGAPIRNRLNIPQQSFEIGFIELGNVDDDDVRQFAQWLPLLPDCDEVLFNGGSTDRITDAAIPYVCQMKNLSWLSLTSKRITDAGLKSLSGMPRVQMLNIGRARIRQAGMLAIQQNFPQLTSLAIQSRVMKDDDLEPLTGLQKLRSLDLNLANSNAATLLSVSRLNITHLTLRESQTWHSSAVSEIASMPHLRLLSLSNCGIFTDSDLDEISKSGSIDELRIFLSTGVSPTGLVQALEKNRRLYVHIGRPLGDAPELRSHPQITVSSEGPTHHVPVLPSKPESARKSTTVSSLPINDLPDITRLPTGRIHVFGTKDQPMQVGTAGDIKDFVEIQINGNLGWYGLRATGDVLRWHPNEGLKSYREGLDVCVLNRTSGTAYGEWLSNRGEIIQRGHPVPELMSKAPAQGIVDLSRAYPTGDWTALTEDGQLLFIGNTEFPPPEDISDFVSVGNWHDHHIGIRRNGELVAWGRDPELLPDLSAFRFTKIRSHDFYSLLLTDAGQLVLLGKEQVSRVPEEFDGKKWGDIVCAHSIFAARGPDGFWRAWSDSSIDSIVPIINALGPNVSSLSLSTTAAVWIETE